jgi:putative CocE/NonD family hydrolase
MKPLITIAFAFALTSIFSFSSLEAQNRPTSLPPGYRQPDYSKVFDVAPGYEYRYFEKMVTGGDGFKLLTRIYLPKGKGPWPVVVTRTPYVFGGRGDNNPLGREYAKRGIGYIQQDCRGKGGSEGFFKPNIYEREDGIALYKWIAGQKWCKSIGIFGGSYTALTGWLVADSVPDKVKGFYLEHYGVDRHISCYSSGLFREDIMSGWAIDNAEENIRKPERKEGQRPGENYYDFYSYMPQVEADTNVLGRKLQYYRDWITHTDHDDPYWKTGVWGDLIKIPPTIDVPVTIIAGQFDHHEAGTLLGYEMLNPATKAKSRLILGSWNHSFQTTPTHVPTDNAKEFNIQSDMFDWFYELLVRQSTPSPEIRAYAIEDDKWISLSGWPVKPQKERKYYLSDNHFLSMDKQCNANTVTYVYNPANPVYAIGGETLFTSADRRGSQLQPEPGYREDVISFISEPLENDITIAGNVKVVLTADTDVDDTCFGFTLSEMTPDGKAYNMRTAITTLGYRDNPLGKREPYTPGDNATFTISASPIVWTVKAGNRFRLDIKSSDFPEYAVHSNFSGVWAEQAKTRKATQNIHIGGPDGSYLVLPLITI